MSKSVNIDGKNYAIVNCDSCPFYDAGDGGYGSHCQYPISPSAIVGTEFDTERIAEDCPLKESGDQNGLKPCPKCGEPAQRFSNLKGTRWVTGCYKCRLWSRARTADESREEWNSIERIVCR